MTAIVFAWSAQAMAEPAAGDTGREIFTRVAQPACGICHTLRDAGTTGEVGPSLDELHPSVERVTAAVRGGLGTMPAYRDTLSDAEIAAVAAYVAKAASP